MAMNGCAVLVVLCAVGSEDAVAHYGYVVEDCASSVAVSVGICLVDAVLDDDAVDDCADGCCQAVAEGADGSASVNDGLIGFPVAF